MDSPTSPQRPVVVIIGRPNVGKSALFNRILGRRLAIVHEQSGVTRDRVMAPAEYNEKHFVLADTGGLGFFPDEKKGGTFDHLIKQQVEAVLQEAAKVIFVVDAIAGQTPLDREIALFLRRYGRPVVMAVNKVDNMEMRQTALNAFADLGFAASAATSSLHGFGFEELLEEVVKGIPRGSPAPELEPRLRLAVVGRPNVGKSSLVNRLTQSQRMIVSEIPGTTRDAVDVPVVFISGERRLPAVLVDTAGLRRKSKVDSSVEWFSVNRAQKAIERVDAVLFVFDVSEPPTAQDCRIASLISEAHKPCLLVANKWDLLPAASKKTEFRKGIKEAMPFMTFAPVIPVSALHNQHLDNLLEALFNLQAQMQITIPTAVLNQYLHDLTSRTPPPAVGGKAFKIFYCTMVSSPPPRILIFVNHRDLCSRTYLSFLENRIQEAFYPNSGMPVGLQIRERPQPEADVRRPRIIAARMRAKHKGNRADTPHYGPGPERESRNRAEPCRSKHQPSARPGHERKSRGGPVKGRPKHRLPGNAKIRR